MKRVELIGHETTENRKESVLWETLQVKEGVRHRITHFRNNAAIYEWFDAMSEACPIFNDLVANIKGDLYVAS